MDLTQLLPWLTGPAGAIVVFALYQFLILTGRLHTDKEMQDKKDQIAAKDREIAEWKSAWELERRRGDASVLAAQTATTVLGAIRSQQQQQSISGGTGGVP